MQVLLSVFFAVFLSVSFSSAAHAVQEDPLTGGQVKYKVTEVAPTNEELKVDSAWENLVSGGENLPMVADLSQLIVLGKEVFEIIKEGKPSVNVQRDTFAVVPEGVKEWQQLSGWKAPSTRVYSVVMANGFGKDVVNLRLKVTAVPGGKYNGKGQYLSNVTIVPTMIRVGWGINLEVWSEAREPVNVGTMQDPIAAIGIDVRFKAKTWISEVNGAQDYFVRGDGDIMTVYDLHLP